jgi:AbiJ N-terminal domain 4
MTTPPFSERMGFKKPKEIQLKGLDAELRNSLWNICRSYWFTKNTKSNDLRSDHHIYQVACLLYRDFYKQPIDALPFSASDFVKSQLQFFQHEGPWHDVLDLVEFLGDSFPDGAQQQFFRQKINDVLELEKSAFRFVGGKLARLTNPNNSAWVGGCGASF